MLIFQKPHKCFLMTVLHSIIKKIIKRQHNLIYKNNLLEYQYCNVIEVKCPRPLLHQYRHDWMMFTQPDYEINSKKDQFVLSSFFFKENKGYVQDDKKNLITVGL